MEVKLIVPMLVSLFGKNFYNNDIISMFEVAYLMAAPLIGGTLKAVGRKNYIIIGYAIVVFATAGFGALSVLDDP